MFPNVDQLGLAFYLALAAISATILVTFGIRFPKLRLVAGDVIMFFVRHFALLFRRVFVATVLFPLYFFRRCHPSVPYHSANDEEPKPMVTKFDPSKYKVSDYDFSKRFRPVSDRDDEDETGGPEEETGGSKNDSDSDWVELEDY